MAFLLMLPLGIFAVVMLIVGSVFVSVEITERRRARRKSRRVFRPVIIEGGKGEIVAADVPPTAADDTRAEPIPIKLVRSAPL
jgi:hypothetical protein